MVVVPVPQYITLDGIIGGLVTFVAITLIAMKMTRSRQSWRPGLVFAIMVEIAISMILTTGYPL